MKQIAFFWFILTSNYAIAQVIHKKIEAYRTETSPIIDGVIEPELWSHLPKAKNWSQLEPKNGEPERLNQKSEVQFMYDDRALYIGAMFYDSSPDSIFTEFSLRDEGNKNCDWFGVWISPYNDAQNEFMFALTAAGVQQDSRSTIEGSDKNWDAVWQSAVNINEKGWSAEIEIPYSALRIPNTQIQEWGINVGREIRRTREFYSWNPIDISNSNYAAQAGILTGIKNIEAPLRLSVMPYISSYIDFYESQSSNNTNGGLDLKYGIDDSFTLDVTLIPDFGQTVFDNQILNVSPFEIQFDENRSFFSEGTELFNKSNLFYSRRIGDKPSSAISLSENEIVVESPSRVQMLNASKISGRTAKGLGIGFFNAITEKTYATVEDTISGETSEKLIEPLSNYNVLVLDQVLKNNSYITFTNTNVSRQGDAKDANVEKLQIQIGTKENRYTLYGDVAFSHLIDSINTNGFASLLHFNKSSGNFQFSLQQNIESDTYDINDLGYLQNNNEQKRSAKLKYFIFNPIGKLRKAHFEISYTNSMLYSPNLFNSNIAEAKIRLHSTKFFSSGISIKQTIGNTYDYFEARTNDLNHVFIYGPSLDLYWWNSTDYRNKFSGDLGFGYDAIPEFDSRSYQIRWAPRFRVNNHLFMTYVISHKLEHNNVGRAFDSNYTNLEDEQGNILFSKRKRKTITNVYKLSYVVNNELSFDLKLRHYWSTLQHKNFYQLEDGILKENDFTIQDSNNTPLYDINYNTWNIDLNCIWRFAPGSELNCQWKNSISNLISDANLNTLQNLNRLFEESQGNSLSLRMVYFLDYQYLKNRNK
tara:strand:- start:2104 stop:4545 length:2442 start_codon:yes stop_codon:yes gene_type:complete